MDQVIQNIAQNVEERLAGQLERRYQLHLDDLAKIRKKMWHTALEQIKQECLSMGTIRLGHGVYTQLTDEKEFLEVSKKSKDVVCHFYKPGSPQCKMVDRHLRLLAPKHVEARFVALDVERFPLLTKRLRIRIIPTIVLVKDSKTKEYITDLGNCDDYSTEMLESRIARSEVIEDLPVPPKKIKKHAVIRTPGRILGILKRRKIKKRKGFFRQKHMRWYRGADQYYDIDFID